MTGGTCPASSLLNLQWAGNSEFFNEAEQHWHSGTLFAELLQHSSIKSLTSCNKALSFIT